MIMGHGLRFDALVLVASTTGAGSGLVAIDGHDVIRYVFHKVAGLGKRRRETALDLLHPSPHRRVRVGVPEQSLRRHLRGFRCHGFDEPTQRGGGALRSAGGRPPAPGIRNVDENGNRYDDSQPKGDEYSDHRSRMPRRRTKIVHGTPGCSGYRTRTFAGYRRWRLRPVAVRGVAD
jgi:hypothetical protein